MITIIFNNKEYEVEDKCTLFNFIETQISTDKKFYCAVALNGHFIPRVQYSTTILSERDVIDIVMPMQGG